jgi:fatty-acyl-CoA synthase
MFHIGGLGVHTLPLLYLGGISAILPAFDPEKTLATMARERVTVQFLVPAMWSALMAVPGFEGYDLSALELAVTAGAPCPLPVLEYFQGKGVPFQEGFGLTETAPTVSILDADHVKAKAGSIGRPLFHVQTRIVDEKDRDVPTGEVGELVVRGPNVFAGYWGFPGASENLEARRFHANCLPMSPVGCSTSARTRRWSTPGTATTRPWARNARTWANGGSGVGDPVKATLTFRESSR